MNQTCTAYSHSWKSGQRGIQLHQPHYIYALLSVKWGLHLGLHQARSRASHSCLVAPHTRTSIYIYTYTWMSCRLPSTWLMVMWNGSGVALIPNGSQRKQYLANSVLKVPTFEAQLSRGIWEKPWLASNLVKKLAPANSASVSSLLGTVELPPFNALIDMTRIHPHSQSPIFSPYCDQCIHSVQLGFGFGYDAFRLHSLQLSRIG